MNDFALVAVMVVFFAVAALLVSVCERIIGPDLHQVMSTADEDMPETAEPAPCPKGEPA